MMESKTSQICDMLTFVKHTMNGIDTSYQLPQVVQINGLESIFQVFVQINLSGCVAIVTGANTGIGKETARGLHDRGAKVIMACRNIEKAEEAAKDIAPGSINLKIKKCDLSSFASVREFCRQIVKEEKKVDILINNAGMVTYERQLTEDGQEMQFQVKSKMFFCKPKNHFR